MMRRSLGVNSMVYQKFSHVNISITGEERSVSVMANSFASLLALIIGSVLVLGGVSVRSEDVVADATSAANQANIHQLATVVELYYSDHGTYPDVSGGEELIELLEREEYIRNRPLDPKVFIYEPKNNAQDYRLALNSNPPEDQQ